MPLSAIDADIKLIPWRHVGARGGAAAERFIGVLAGRLANRARLASDGRKPCREVVEQSIGADIDDALPMKIQSDVPGEERYSPGQCIGAVQRRVEGNPNPAHTSTSNAERANLSMRVGMRRFTRLAISLKKAENRAHARHPLRAPPLRAQLGCPPAMAAGVGTNL